MATQPGTSGEYAQYVSGPVFLMTTGYCIALLLAKDGVPENEIERLRIEWIHLPAPQSDLYPWTGRMPQIAAIAHPEPFDPAVRGQQAEGVIERRHS